MPTNYKNGKIYQIVSDQTDKVYIGSTTQKLCQRMSHHRSDFSDHKSNISSKELLQFSDAKILLLEDFPCDNKEQLIKREGEVMRTFENRVNKCIAGNLIGRTQKEYYIENKERAKEYYEKNKEVISEKQKVYNEKNKEAISERQKVYNEKNKEAIIENAKEYREKNRETLNEKQKVYSEKNKEAIREHLNSRVTCEICSQTMNFSSLRLHNQTKKHLANIASGHSTIHVDQQAKD